MAGKDFSLGEGKRRVLEEAAAVVLRVDSQAGFLGVLAD